MALDREKTFANAERLLKQGKVALALDECKRLAEDAPRDLLMLNRVGDFLARSNRGADAIVYYEMIASQFSASGFYPKAIAILKKIVKVDPTRLTAVVQLGELNLKQKLPGEARSWLLQAAEEYLRRREFGNARDVYEKLAAAEPDSIVHVVRLAEARAAEGDTERAGLDLVALGHRLLTGGRADEAQRSLKRASELLPNRAEALVGLARCEAAAGRSEDARRLAEEAWSTGQNATAIVGDVFLLFEELGDADRSARLLQDERSDGIPADAIETAFRKASAGGGVDALWSRVVPLIDRWARTLQFDRSAALLERIARSEDGGNVRALEHLVELRKAEGNRGVAARAVERLVRACQAKGLTAKIQPQLETLKLLDPTSPLLFLGRPAGESPASPTPHAPATPAAPAASTHDVPAVPLTPADAEFVNGNLTEAEVFEKYGLHREALQQLRQITSRFPGHVIAQDKLVGFLRTQPDRAALRDGLVALALAKRASGDIDGAKGAVREASTLGSFDNAIRAVLEGFALLEAPRVPAAPPPPPPPPPPKVAAPPVPPVPPSVSSDEDGEMEIVFDDVDEPVTEAASAGHEMLEEIEFYLVQGMQLDALRRIEDARAAGVDAARLDALDARARAGSSEVVGDAVDAVQPLESVESAEGDDRLDEEDLSSITAALEAEFGTDRVPDAADAPTEPESEQSLEEVFETFKEHVNAAVDVGDFQTHYDLGIAYKEMGLMDAALEEFRLATGAPQLYREACSMLGLCHWDAGRSDEAIRWYRAALHSPGGEEVGLSGLRYDLADKLEQTGDEKGAYELFAQVVQEEPGYRDGARRLASLRTKLGL
jgi:tetratricopeptide (TPR) repeat protein